LAQPQVFLTTHSPTVITELYTKEIFAVRSKDGTTTVQSVEAKAKNPESAQKHLRRDPEAFLARRIAVGEGRTEQGLIRGLDDWWASIGLNSLALQGAVAIDGGGKDKAPIMCEYLLDLDHRVFLLHDTDEAPNKAFLSQVRNKGGQIEGWPGECSTEQRIFLDLPWDSVCSLLKYAMESESPDSVLAHVQHACEDLGDVKIASLDTCAMTDSPRLRQILGRAAKSGKWFKDITRAEHLGKTIGPCLAKIRSTPLAKTLAQLRKWIDAEL
jgi:putative ATP-dependent endonuclease of OLD family